MDLFAVVFWLLLLFDPRFLFHAGGQLSFFMSFLFILISFDGGLDEKNGFSCPIYHDHDAVDCMAFFMSGLF